MRVFALILAVFLASCSSVEKRVSNAHKTAHAAGFSKRTLEAGDFTLVTYYKFGDRESPVNIYIEGDGFAWVDRSRPSANPTPYQPLALELAVLDNAANVVYIARPCQFTPFSQSRLCHPKYWTDARFAPEVVESVDKAVSYYKGEIGNGEINLIGYSGGAAVAALVAAVRDDIKTLRTVAGNLDHVRVNDYHGVSRMEKSLNPVDVIEKLSNVPQYHFIGENDKVIPAFTVTDFTRSARRAGGCASVSVVKGVDHHSGWIPSWRHLLTKPLYCN